MARYIHSGKSKIYFLPAVANKAAPSSGEIAAGTDVSASVSEPGDFTFANEPVETPDLSTTFTSQIPGRDAAGSPTMNFYDDDASTTIRTLLAKGVTGFILRARIGMGTGKPAEVFPVTVTGQNDVPWTTGNDAAQFAVGLAVTSPPVLTAVLP